MSKKYTRREMLGHTARGAALLGLGGTAGLLWLKTRRPPERRDRSQLGLDLAFLILLFETSLTGLLLLAFRAAAAIRRGVSDRAGMTGAIESTLAIHTVGSIWLVGCVLFQHWWS